MLHRYVRGDFPGLGMFRSYLNTASYGLIPRQARDYTSKFVMEYSDDPLGANNLLVTLYERYLGYASSLFNVPKSLVSFTFKTTECISRVLHSISPGRGDEVLVSSHNFPSSLYLAESYCRRSGCVVKYLPCKTDYRLHDYVSGRTKAVIIDSVNWVTGERIELAPLAEVLEYSGGYLLVDAIQHLGVVPAHDLVKWGDLICAGGQKWLLAPTSGMGVMITSKRLAESLDPLSYSLGNLEEVDWESFWADPDKGVELGLLSGSARRFAPLTLHSSIGLVLLGEAIKYLSNVGVEAVWSHVVGLRHMLLEEAERRGFEVLSPLDEDRSSGIVLLDINREWINGLRIVKILSSRGVSVSFRGQCGISGMRVSMHLYNSPEDIYSFLDELEYVLGGGYG